MNEQMLELYNAVIDHADLEIDTIIDAANYGADSGFGGFTKNVDCIKFWDKNELVILEYSQEMAEELGEKNWMMMYSSFGRSDMIDDGEGFKTLGAWFILEEVGRWLEENRNEVEALDDEEDEEEEHEERVKEQMIEGIKKVGLTE